MVKRNRVAVVSSSVIPTVEEAVGLYQQAGGHLTTLQHFRLDPLDCRPDLQNARYNGFTSKYPDFESIFYIFCCCE